MNQNYAPDRIGQSYALDSIEQRKLPETPEERLEAYLSALKRIRAFFQLIGFGIVDDDSGQTVTATKGRFTIDLRVMENTNVVCITSGLGYRADKAGTKDSNAKITNARSVMKARHLLRVTVSGTQSIPIFVELRQSIRDPELEIIRAVLFILRSALESGTDLNTSLKDTAFLRDVPTEWLPAPSTQEAFPELADLAVIQDTIGQASGGSRQIERGSAERY